MVVLALLLHRLSLSFLIGAAVIEETLEVFSTAKAPRSLPPEIIPELSGQDFSGMTGGLIRGHPEEPAADPVLVSQR